DVAQRADELDDASILAAQPDAAVEHPLVAAARIGDAVLVLELRRSALEVLDERCAVTGVILRMHPGVPGRRRQLLSGDGEESLGALGEIERTGDEIPLIDSLDRRRGGECVALFGLLEGGDVAGRADHAVHPALIATFGAPQADAVLARPAPAAVERAVAVIALVALGLALEVVDE